MFLRAYMWPDGSHIEDDDEDQEEEVIGRLNRDWSST